MMLITLTSGLLFSHALANGSITDLSYQFTVWIIAKVGMIELLLDVDCWVNELCPPAWPT